MRPFLLLLFICFTAVNSYHGSKRSRPKISLSTSEELKGSSSSESEEKSKPSYYIDDDDASVSRERKTVVNSYYGSERSHPKISLKLKDSSSYESDEKSKPSVYVDEDVGSVSREHKTNAKSHRSKERSHPRVLLTSFDELLNYKSSYSSESKEKRNPLYYVEEKDIARAWASSCDKNAPLWCKRACKRALDLTCGDFPEQCTSDFKTTLIEDCRAECRFEFDSTFNFNSYVRPKPHKNGKDKKSKDNKGKHKNGKDKKGKDKKGKDKNGKEESNGKKKEDKNGKDKKDKDKNAKEENNKKKEEKITTDTSATIETTAAVQAATETTPPNLTQPTDTPETTTSKV